MKFESYEEYIVDRLKQLSKDHPDTVYYWAEREDWGGGVDYLCQKRDKETFSNEELAFINEDFSKGNDLLLPYTLCLDQDTISTVNDRDIVFKFKNGIVYAPNEEI